MPEEEPVASVEVLITKTLGIGGSWEGKVSKTKPAVLKLDIKSPCAVHMLLEGKDIWATVEKSDRLTENPPRTQTDPETDRMIISWEAETGSYLITLGPVEPNLLGMLTVTFMDNKAYTAWEAEQEQFKHEPEEIEQSEEDTEPEETEQLETETEPEGESEAEPVLDENEEEPVIETEKEQPEGNQQEENQPESEETSDEEQQEEEPDEEEPDEEEPDEEEQSEEESQEEEQQEETETDIKPHRHIDVEVSWDVDDPRIGDTAHFQAVMYGYEGLNYTMQWQYSPDDQTWYDIVNATEETFDVVVTEENNVVYWRVIVYLEEPVESTEQEGQEELSEQEQPEVQTEPETEIQVEQEE